MKSLIGFNQDLYDILGGNFPSETGHTDSEYAEVMKIASNLNTIDLSSQHGARERIWRRLMNRRPDKEAVMNRVFREHRTALVFSTAVIITLFSFGMAFPNAMSALADNINANVSKVLQLGPFTTVMQVKGQPPQEDILTQEEKDKLAREGVITKQTAEGEVMISVKSDASEKKMMESTVSYPSLSEAQKAVCFKLLAPGYLPSGYHLKEARTFKGSDMYINLYFSGPGDDIILMQRLLNEETHFGFATNAEIESVQVGGIDGAWAEPNTLMWEKDGVSYSLFSGGYGQEEALKMAGSIK